MPQFFLNKRLIVLLVSIIVLVALIGFSLQDRQKLSWPEQFVKDSVGFVQSAVHMPAQSLAGFFETINDIINTYEENKVLKERLGEVSGLQQQIQELEQEIEDLNEIVGKTESLSDYTAIQATVIARNPSRWNEIITINRGSQHGVEKNMAVITAKGLIGKIKQTSQFTSTVQLITSPDRSNRISAYVQGDQKTVGVISYDEEKQALILKTIDQQVKVDQLVLTSGLGGIFPSRIEIGKVTEVVQDDHGLEKTAYIKPNADLNDIDNVLVIKREMVKPEIGIDEEE